MTEEVLGGLFPARDAIGSFPGNIAFALEDVLGITGSDGGNTGLRIASAIPAPGAAVFVLLAGLIFSERRRTTVAR